MDNNGGKCIPDVYGIWNSSHQLQSLSQAPIQQNLHVSRS